MNNSVSPNSEVVLLHVPLEISNKNQLKFANSNAQFNYFRNLTEQYTYDKVTYIRKDDYVVINDNFENINKYNYMMYQNENYSGKWFYAFITRMEWLSHNSTAVYFVTDSWQTYQFDIEFKPSFVEREMIDVSDDVPRSKPN